MAGTRTSWITGAGLVGVAVLALSWIFMISPMRTQTEANRETAELQAVQNDVRAQEVIRLTEQYQQLGEFRAELADLQAAITAVPELPALTRELHQAAEDTGVTLVQMTSGAPVAHAGAPAVAAADQAADGATTAESSADPVVAPEAAGALTGLASMQVGFTVIGSYDDVSNFISMVQTGTDRLLLVSAITATRLDAAMAGGGRPATQAGDVEATLTAYAFTLSDGSAAASTVDEEGPVELPESDRDPFTPVN